MRMHTYEKQLKIEERCSCEGRWLLDHPRTSIREMAKNFMISKSQVHRDIHKLRFIDNDMYAQCRMILKKHKMNNFHK